VERVQQAANGLGVGRKPSRELGRADPAVEHGLM
jgi:hypothetical protein